MRERMEEMNRQMQSFVEYVRTEMLTRFQQAPGSAGAIVPIRRPTVVAKTASPRKPRLTRRPPGQLESRDFPARSLIPLPLAPLHCGYA
jgi:hypothetical protein